MAKEKIEESQQQSQGVAIRTQGNQDMKIPQGTRGTHHRKAGGEDRQIPNQERSSASNMGKTRKREQHP